MAKKGMKHLERQHVHPKNDLPPVPEFQGKVKHTKEKAPPVMDIREGRAVWAADGKDEDS